MIPKDWKSALLIVRPETVISWQRNRFKTITWAISYEKSGIGQRLS
jgi:hypothetical protein